MTFVGIEHNAAILDANVNSMPGGKPKLVSEELGSIVRYGYRTDRARILHTDFGDMILRAQELENAQRQAFWERWENWDGVWLDLCSNLAPKSMDDLTLVLHGCARRIVPICVTIMAGREAEKEMKQIAALGGGSEGRSNLVAVQILGERYERMKELEYFEYRHPSVRSPGKGSSMIVVMLLVDNR